MCETFQLEQQMRKFLINILTRSIIWDCVVRSTLDCVAMVLPARHAAFRAVFTFKFHLYCATAASDDHRRQRNGADVFAIKSQRLAFSRAICVTWINSNGAKGFRSRQAIPWFMASNAYRIRADIHLYTTVAIIMPLCTQWRSYRHHTKENLSELISINMLSINPHLLDILFNDIQHGHQNLAGNEKESDR